MLAVHMSAHVSTCHHTSAAHCSCKVQAFEEQGRTQVPGWHNDRPNPLCEPVLLLLHTYAITDNLQNAVSPGQQDMRTYPRVLAGRSSLADGSRWCAIPFPRQDRYASYYRARLRTRKLTWRGHAHES